MKSTYFRFVELVHSLEVKSAQVSTIDQTAKQLLILIALRHEQGKAMTVSEAMAMTSIASPATIHIKLDALREAALIEQVFEGKNRRTKYLVPTKLADKYFISLGEVMKKAIEAS